MTRKFETKEYFFEDKLKMLAIVKTKIYDEQGFVERKTHLVNTKAEKILEIKEIELKTEGSNKISKTNLIKCYEYFFVVETFHKNNEKEKTDFKGYSYHGKLLHTEPRPWDEATGFLRIENRFKAKKAFYDEQLNCKN